VKLLRLSLSVAAFAGWALFASAGGQDTRFNHKKHATLRLPCTYCHAKAQSGERATFPSISTCRTCHTEASTPALFNLLERSPAEIVEPTQRVYAVEDYVFFAHGPHAKAGIGCDTCHGQVYQQEVLQSARPATMKACVDCHKQYKATLECNACHELGH
jgi:hypothetical protein